MQNDFVIRAKKAIKKVAAIAGSAVFASSMIAPAMAYTLSDLPAPFVSNGTFDANVIVGSQTWNHLIAGDPAGVASDLAGAIDVAAAFAQQAKKTTSSSGKVTLTRDTTPGLLKNSTGGYLGIGDTPDSNRNIFNNSVEGFEWMVNETVEWNDTDYPVWEVLKATNSFRLENTGYFSDEVGGGVVYNITSNGTQTFPVGFDGLPIFGQTYQITELGTDYIMFGQVNEEKNVKVDQVINVGDKATVKIIGYKTNPVEAYIVITDADGNKLVDEYKPEGYTYKNDSEGYSITLKEINLDAVLGDSFEIDWTTSLTKLEHDGNASAIDPNLEYWKVRMNTNGGNNLSWIAFLSPSNVDHTLSLSPGEYFEVKDYFNITFDGWRDNNYTDLSIRDITESVDSWSSTLVYKNNDSTPEEVSVSFGAKHGEWDASNRSAALRMLRSDDIYLFKRWYDGNLSVMNMDQDVLYNLTPTNATTDMSRNYTFFNVSGAWYVINYTDTEYNVSLKNWTAGSGTNPDGSSYNLYPEYGYGLKFLVNDENEFSTNGTVSGRLTITEGIGTSTVNYEDNAIDNLEIEGVSGSDDLAVGETKYSTWGASYTRATSSVSVSYPEGMRKADIWIGRDTSEGTDFEVGDEITGTEWTVASVGGESVELTPVTPGIGVVDSSVAFNSLSKPAILVGGPSVNQGVSLLASEGTGVSADQITEDRAYIQLIDDAFGSGQTVLVIAGYAAKDTRLACQVLAAKLNGLSNIDLSGNLVWLDTSGSTYQQVTVVEE